jgi:hypothetical protein
MGHIGMDLEHPDAVPYFNCDAPVTNARVRQALADGSEDDKCFWIAKIMRERSRFVDARPCAHRPDEHHFPPPRPSRELTDRICEQCVDLLRLFPSRQQRRSRAT